MKIQYIAPNTIEAYKPSNTTLTLKNEQNRIFRAENFDWDNNWPLRLSDLCIQVLAKNYVEYVANSCILYCDLVKVLYILPTDLDLEKTIFLVQDEQYWKRRYEEHFPLREFKKHYNWTWKCVYLEQYISTFCENAESQYQDEESIDSLLDLCEPYIHMLHIYKLREWDYPRTNITKSSKVKPDIHINFTPILKKLPYITELTISFAPHLIKDKFDFHIFRIDPVDCANLVNAILCLPLLTILRIRRSWINDKCLQKLVQRLIENERLTELDLAYCNIGDNGAKYIAHLMMVHDNLKTINLRGNHIGTEGCNGIAWAFMNPAPCRIHSVDLGLNPIGDEGVINLLKALVRSKIPKQLSLAGCSIKENAHFVGKMLAINVSLNILDISSNEFDEEAGEAILQAVDVNKKLTQIFMRDTLISPGLQKQIQEILKKNVLLQVSKKSNFNLDFMKYVMRSSSEDSYLDF